MTLLNNVSLDQVKLECDRLDREAKSAPRQKYLSTAQILAKLTTAYKVNHLSEITNLSPELITPFCNEGSDPVIVLGMLKNCQKNIDNPKPKKKKRKRTSPQMPSKKVNYAKLVIEAGHINVNF